ncbi:MAG: 1-deoxy-D-xylulose-5-phosphate synthase [Acutalibacteraceae bacterium]|nr:1-deoxy-D-xylulose-5-phosphate synthase [Acutalibacteraceae bacterium]
MEYKLLSKIKSPDDLKKLNELEMPLLCQEIRDCIVHTVSKNGGHLASNLGAVELTVALHRSFSSPEDAIIFDVGHQCYTHKLLTGRFDKFSTIRTENGLSGYMRPDESEHDPFITGHSSNSISAAYGIYRAKKLKGESGTAVAVIGDGAMTGGMAYEALNNAGSGRSNFIVVLNDNKMSISRNVGALARTFTKMRNKPHYHAFKFALSHFLLAIPFVGKSLNNAFFQIKEGIKGLVYKNNVFTALGFNYLGPVDGHNIKAMEQLFKIAETYTRPSFIHVITTKGKGYAYAESSPKDYHGVSPFDVSRGAKANGRKTFSDIAGDTLCSLARNDDKVCAVTAAMTTGTGLTEFASLFKNRFFDVGIAEQHAVTFSAGLASKGMKPFFVVYSSFLQRGFDQIIHDIAIGGYSVKLLIDRAGIVGEDGETHQGMFDVSFLTSVPGANIYSPCYYGELQYDIKLAAGLDGLCAVRYPRGCEKEDPGLDYTGDFTILNGSGKKAIVTYGRLFSDALEAKEQVPDINIVKLNKIFPLSDKLVETLKNYNEIHFFEEGIKSGGIGELCASALLEKGYNGIYRIHAVDNKFVPTATVTAAIKGCGLDTDSMISAVKNNE